MIVHKIDMTTFDSADGCDTMCGMWFCMDFDPDTEETSINWNEVNCKDCLEKKT